MKLFNTVPVGLNGFVRVEHSDEFVQIFNKLYSLQSEVLYNHSRIYPFSYLNKGNYELYLNQDFREDKIIPVVKKYEQRLLDKVNEQKPQYALHTPHCGLDDIWNTLSILDPLSSVPVEITDVTKAYATDFLEQVAGWEKVKTSDDIIQSAQALAECKGRNFSSLRNTLKHVREDLKPQIQAIDRTNYEQAIRVFEKWKEVQGKKYFRVTVGRDVRLIREYFKKVDLTNFFGYVYFVNEKESATSFGCRSCKDPAWGQDVTVKADINCRGLGDFAFMHLMSEMNKAGINTVNDSGGTGKVKLNKIKFRPIGTIPMYDLRRI